DEDIDETLQHEEAFLDFVGVRGVALPRLDVHDREGKAPGRNNSRILVLAGAAGADEAMLGALVTLDLGILERGPVRLLVAEATDMFRHDVFDRDADEFRGKR